MMRIKTSQATEDYLKAIYTITRKTDRASTNDIATRMGVSPASATGMVQKLASAQPPLLQYEKHRGAALTQKGERIALEIIRHHRLLETFLHEKLGYTWDEVHEEADQLEHVISEELEERIARALGDPHYDPHGDPIPNREFHLPHQSSISMAELQPGDQAVVVRISTDNPDLLRYLTSIGLSLQSRIRVINVSPYDGITSLIIDGKDGSRILGSRITDKIFVDLHPNQMLRS
jgi:DtxR family Mn-dependent transcriptional regulator